MGADTLVENDVNRSLFSPRKSANLQENRQLANKNVYYESAQAKGNAWEILATH